MSLIVCPECSREISSYAVACPSCGYPTQCNLPRARLLFYAVVCTLFALFCMAAALAVLDGVLGIFALVVCIAVAVWAASLFAGYASKLKSPSSGSAPKKK
jgi:hypothetical protein